MFFFTVSYMFPAVSETPRELMTQFQMQLGPSWCPRYPQMPSLVWFRRMLVTWTSMEPMGNQVYMTMFSSKRLAFQRGCYTVYVHIFSSYFEVRNCFYLFGDCDVKMSWVSDKPCDGHLEMQSRPWPVRKQTHRPQWRPAVVSGLFFTHPTISCERYVHLVTWVTYLCS